MNFETFGKTLTQDLDRKLFELRGFYNWSYLTDLNQSIKVLLQMLQNLILSSLSLFMVDRKGLGCNLTTMFSNK